MLAPSIRASARLALALIKFISPADLRLLPRQSDSVSQCHDGNDFNCNSILHKNAVLIHALCFFDSKHNI
jgi:hypothetical protein